MASSLAMSCWLGGCGGGGGAAPAGDPPAPAQVARFVATQADDGSVQIEFRLSGAAGSVVTPVLRYSVDQGATWRVARSVEPAGSVELTEESERHVLTWDAVADAGAHVTGDVLFELSVIEEDAPEEGAGALRVARAVADPPRASARLDNLRVAADRVQGWMMHFGSLDEQTIELAEQHDLVVLYPGQPTVTAAAVAEIRDGVDPEDPADDVMVLGYVQVGEDLRTIGLSDSQMLADARFLGDASGPRVDPRGRGAAGQTLVDLDPLGLPAVSTGYASWFLDDASLETDGIGDGLPDRNGRSGACFANMGDPAWFDALDAMTLDGPDGVAGFAELLDSEVGRGFGFDGLYLDGVDTCAPNAWTGPGDPVQSEFEWTAGGYLSLLERVRGAYPTALLMQNRGLFFFNPVHPQAELPPGQHLDFVLFSSYRLDADLSRPFDDYFFADNKHNFMPKLQAEAFRPGGFQVLSLGFAAGPAIDPQTLLDVGGTARGAGFDELMSDLREAHDEAGFRHYLMDAGGQIANTFVREHAEWGDDEPPVWSSTFNANQLGYPAPPEAPTPRVGVQQAIGGEESVTLRFDVALDKHPVHYVAYYTALEIDWQRPDAFTEPLFEVYRERLAPTVGSEYLGVAATPSGLPFETTIHGLLPGRRYWFCVRAVDSLGNEDPNRVILSARTLGTARDMAVDGSRLDWFRSRILGSDGFDRRQPGGPDIRRVRAVHDADNLYLLVESSIQFDLFESGEPTLTVLIDADDDPFTGRGNEAVGGDLAVVGTDLIARPNGEAEGVVLQTVPVLPQRRTTWVELSVPIAQLDAVAGGAGAARTLRLKVLNSYGDDEAPNVGYYKYVLRR